MGISIRKLIECDRCHKKELLQYIGTKEFDGGYTRENQFEKPEKKWGYHTYGTLCPECEANLVELKRRYMANESCIIIRTSREGKSNK